MLTYAEVANAFVRERDTDDILGEEFLHGQMRDIQNVVDVYRSHFESVLAYLLIQQGYFLRADFINFDDSVQGIRTCVTCQKPIYSAS